MPSLMAQIVRYISDDPQPGLVECVLIDAFNQSHLFIEKTAIVSSESLRSTSAYPTMGKLACKIVAEWTDDDGRSFARVCTEQPWGIVSSKGATKFVVRSSQLSQ
jgi:hypothetical protein